MDSYITIKDRSEFRFEDRRSVFIGLAAPVTTEEEALAFIACVKKRFPDARHWVYAYVVRENNVMRYTDDREPQGTAGMPVLDIIRKNGCTDTVIVVVRYFGGILLGTGGLVHAYTEAALGALKEAKIIKYSVYSTLQISVSYTDYQKILPVLAQAEFITEDTEYTDNVKITGCILLEKKEKSLQMLNESTSGRIEIVTLAEKFDFRE